jgi:hypothetical protein
MNNNTPTIDPAAILAAAAENNPAAKPQPLPWHMAESGLPEIYDAAGELVTAFGNDMNGLSMDYTNARFVVAAVNAVFHALRANA